MTIRVALGHIDTYDRKVGAFAQQLGVTSVQFHDPGNLDASAGYWSLTDLEALRQLCDEDHLMIEGLENVPPLHFWKIQHGVPGRDAQIENYMRTIENMARAGIRILGYNFIATYVWRTDMHARGRGGAFVSAFDLADVATKGNALRGYKLDPGAAAAGAPEEGLTEDVLWANHQYFLDAVLPIAEREGVRLALHPDDPPVSTPLGGAARIFTSPESLDRAAEQAKGSPAWGLDLCLGTVSEMGGETAVNRVIDRFGPDGKIVYIHFRDVRGTADRFLECFLGEGNYNPTGVLRRLMNVGFDGFLIDDHVPAMVGDPDTWLDTSTDAYCSRGRAHAIGYLQGLLGAIEG